MKDNTKINVFSAVLLQLVTVICGFILPKLTIQSYGSDVNGLISSLNQFLCYISLMEGGIGGVVVASLYRPLVEKNEKKVNGIMSAANVFFRKIAIAFIGYTIIIAIVYPLVINGTFSLTYISALIFILSIGYFIQFYFAVVFKLLLQAGQRIYIVNAIQIITIILNTVFSVIMIKSNMSIHLVKLFSSLVFLIQPIFLKRYIANNFSVDMHVEPDHEALSQRWNGFGQNTAFFIHSNTDIIIITLFMKDLTEVSVYSVYLMIVLGLRDFIAAISSGFSPTLGNLLAKRNMQRVKEVFNKYEFIMYNVSVFAFSCCALLIVSFVEIYMTGITEGNYSRPIFAGLLVIAEAIYCVREPYISIVYAAGHYKQTAKGAYIEAIINVVVSIALVINWGLEGVAFGTLLAMLYRMAYNIIYIRNNIIERPVILAIKRIIVSILIVITAVWICGYMDVILIENYITWGIQAMIYAGVIIATIIVYNFIFYYSEMKSIRGFKKK